MKEHKCIACWKVHGHYHIGFADGAKNYRHCEDCCRKIGVCHAYLGKDKGDSK